MRANNAKACLAIAFLMFIIFSIPNIAFSGFSKIESNQHRLVLKYSPEFKGFTPITTENGEVAYLPNIINSSVNQSISSGSPIELISSELITVPSPIGFRITNVRVVPRIIERKLIAPKPELTNSSGMPTNIYSIVPNLYSSYTSSDWASLSYEGISRERHTARLTVLASRYDYSTGTIEIPESIEVEIAFDESPNSKQPSVQTNSFLSNLNDTEVRQFKISQDNRTLSGNLTNLNEVSNGNWLRIKITEDGIYKIDASQLASHGINVGTDLVNTIKIFGHGGKNLDETVSSALDNNMKEQAIIVNKKPTGELESIIFYGSSVKGFERYVGAVRHYRNDFSFDNYYLLTFGGREGRRASARANLDNITSTPSWYYHRIFFNEELTNPFPDGGGRIYLGRSFFSNPFMDMFYNLKRDADIQYVFSLAHRSPDPSGRGQFIIKQSGNQIGAPYIEASSGSYTHAKRYRTSYKSPASLISPDGRSVLTLQYSNPVTSATPFFDYYEIAYPREFIPIDNELNFYSDTATGVIQYRINGFSGSVYGFDVSDRSDPILLTNSAVTGGMFIFSKDESDDRFSNYYISGKLKQAAGFESVKLANLRGGMENADVIVISHKQFLETTKEYAEYRSQKSGYKIIVVDVEDIYKEFSSTLPDITAIRDYIAYCYHKWQNKPSYVVLWGDAHYDYRNIQIKSTNFLPTYLNNDFYSNGDITETGTLATDDYYVWVDGNDELVDLVVGRVPIDVKENGAWFVEKLKHYENNSSLDSWRTNILLVADDSYVGPNKYPDGSLHTNQSESLSELLPPDLIVKKLYLADYPTENIAGGKRKPGVSQEFVSFLNTKGALIFNWIGHGNPRVLSHEEYFEREITVPQLTNLDKLFFVTAATCDFGRFDKDGPKSGAEELLFSKVGSAIGLFTAARVVDAYGNHELNTEFYECVFTKDHNTRYPTTGEAMAIAKRRVSRENSQKFLLIGDPTMRFLYPDNTITIESINDIPLSDSTISIKALANIKITARVDDIGGNLDQTFNGSSYLTILDGDENKKVTDDIGAVYYFTTQGAILNRSTYRVEAGRIEANFVIPKDISFSNNNARLFIYANSDNGRYASGSTNKIKVEDIETTSINDGKGPKIEIFFDTYNFKSNDVVRRNPLLLVELWDDTGINSTGLGIGHRIEAWIDDSPNPIDLTSKFSSSIADPKAGSIQHFIYNLEPGLHRIKIRAWDVFNNPNTAEAYFRVPEDGDEKITDVLLYPNPMNDDGIVEIFHNFAPPFEVEMKIFNESGSLVRRIILNSTTLLTTQFPWDGRDEAGNILPQGAYYYFVRLSSKNNGIVQRGGRLGIIQR